MSFEQDSEQEAPTPPAPQTRRLLTWTLLGSNLKLGFPACWSLGGGDWSFYLMITGRSCLSFTLNLGTGGKCRAVSAQVLGLPWVYCWLCPWLAAVGPLPDLLELLGGEVSAAPAV